MKHCRSAMLHEMLDMMYMYVKQDFSRRIDRYMDLILFSKLHRFILYYFTKYIKFKLVIIKRHSHNRPMQYKIVTGTD